MARECEPRLRKVGWTGSPLAVYWTSRTGFTVTVRASFLFYLFAIGFVGLFLQGVTPLLQGGTVTFSLDWGWVYAFVVLELLGTAVHEAGHVTGYRITRMRWVGVTVKIGASVHGEGEPSDGQRAWVSALGPIFEAMFGALLVAFSPLGSVAWLAGLLIAANGVVGLLVPFSPNSDATKIYGALWSLLRQPSDPETARID